MKKGLILITAVLLGILLAGSALAEYGYTSVTQLPMAVDFTLDVDFDETNGLTVITDYPYETTGATQMNLTFGRDGLEEVLVLMYDFATGETCIASSDPSLYSYDDPIPAYRDIGDGILMLSDRIAINTSNFGNGTDWVLTYSISEKGYVEYEENNGAVAFNASSTGSTLTIYSYEDNTLARTTVRKRSEYGDLTLNFDQYGNLDSAYVYLYSGPDSGVYDYDRSTGLFGEHKLSELGFEDADFEIQAPAALDPQA